MSCGNCKFWEQGRGDEYRKDMGECHRYPPVFNPTMAELPLQVTMPVAWIFPVTEKGVTCGEYKGAYESSYGDPH